MFLARVIDIGRTEIDATLGARLGWAVLSLLGGASVHAALLSVPSQYSTIQEAIDAAAPGDEIVVSQGTYGETIDFSGKGITVRSSDPSSPSIVSTTVIDAGAAGSAVTFDGGETASSVLQGMKLTGGSGTVYATGPGSGESVAGGGVFCRDASPTILDCMIQSNDVTAAPSTAGGGVFVQGGAPTLERCTISGNATGGDGGGIFTEGGASLTLVDCSFSANTAGRNGGALALADTCDLTQSGGEMSSNSALRSGGALFGTRESGILLSDCVVTSNSATGDGGAVALEDAAASSFTGCSIDDNGAGDSGGAFAALRSATTIRSCTMSGNDALNFGGAIFGFAQSASIIDECSIGTSSAWQGGGIWLNGPAVFTNTDVSNNDASWGAGLYLENCSPSFSGCTIERNDAQASGGGLLCFDEASPSFDACTISLNSAQGASGGLACWAGSSPELVNCVIDRNQADGTAGGMRCVDESSPYLMNCTIAGNSAGATGGPMSCSGDSRPVIVNTIIWGNSPAAIYSPYSTPKITYSDVQGGWYDEGNLNSDPLFLNEASGDYRLMQDSPCIDSGTPFRAPDVDNEGHTRPTDDGYEMGSDEFIGIICDLGIDILDFTPTLAVGEVLEIDAEISNPCPFSLDFNSVNLRAEGPASAEFRLINNVEVTMRPGETRSRMLRKMVPFDAPAGSYSMTLEVLRGQSVVASEVFAIAVTLSGDILEVPATYPTIQAAVNAAADGDEVVVSPGTYGEWNIRLLGKAITVRGTDPSDSATVAATIVDGGGNDRVFFIADGEHHDTVVSGLTIRGGYAREGGGIACWETAPTISNCVITGCQAHAPGLGGGAIWGKDSDLVLEGCTLTGNSAVSYGGAVSLATASSALGGILALSATPELLDCRIEGNSAANGAGVFFSNVRPMIAGCLVLGNTATGYGGGIFGTNSASATIDSCTVGNNSAAYGGGLSLQRTATTIQGGAIRDNQATAAIFGGGGAFIDRSAVTLSGTNLDANTCAADGGALHLVGGSTTIRNSLLTNSTSSGQGGAIYTTANPVTIQNCTLAGNSAAEGDAIYAQSGGATTGVNNIVTNGGSDELTPTHRVTMSYSIVEGGWSGAGNLDVDPLYRDLGAKDYHLQATACGDAADSPAIDAGDPATTDTALDCETGLGTSAADMGAYGGPGNG